MATFTAPGGADVQSISFLNEIVGGIRERRGAALEDLSPALVVAGRDIQAASFISNLQSAIDYLVPYFVDHTLYPGEGGLAGLEDVPMFDAASFRAAAGLHADGWRRVPAGTDYDPDVNDWTDLEDSMYVYGLQQAGDITLAPWIFDDLQKALDTLRWTYRYYLNYDSDVESRDSYNVANYRAVCADAVAAEAAEWAASAWAAGGAYFYRASADLVKTSQWLAYAQRIKSQPTIDVPTVVPCAIDVYLKPGIAGPGDTFTDIDSLGMQAGKLWHIEQWAAVTPPEELRGGVAEASWIGAIDTSPMGLSGLACPVPGACSVVADYLHAICKWTFSHTL
jgi:hypothetical protein